LRSILPAAVASVALGWSSRLPAQDPAPPKAVDPVVAQLVEAHNQERAKEGLAPLKLEPRLEEAARAHARDMAEHDMMAHEGSDGSTPSQRVVAAGYHYLLTGENVARGQRDVPGVMRSWMDSPPHKKNILGDFTEIGVARVDDKDGKPFWCADFGKPIPKFDPAAAASELVKRINEERATAKVPPLAPDPKLAKAAEDRAAALARNKGQGGATSGFEGIDQGLYREIAMSTAVGAPTPEALAKRLIDNPDLNAQVLGQYALIGVGYKRADDDIPYWCILLANPARR